MSLTLYGAPLSPFVRKVRLLLAEKGLDYQLEAIAPFGQPAWYREISPLAASRRCATATWPSPTPA
ncbi:glutathione S-transferase [Pseudomonas aeruginosa]|nr:glutathione S-transferase [Pseudomonas aeruginosa]